MGTLLGNLGFLNQGGGISWPFYPTEGHHSVVQGIDMDQQAWEVTL